MSLRLKAISYIEEDVGILEQGMPAKRQLGFAET
jgi:hypothetical protein